jgi:hypothetical protein
LASALVDRFGGFQDLLGRMFGAADHGAELTIDLGHLLAVKALAVQDGDLALGAVDRIMDQVELDLELLALLDLCAIGFQQSMCLRNFPCDRSFESFGRGAPGRTRACHLGADRAQLGHDLVMHGPDAGIGDFGHRHDVAGDGFFNAKTFAMNGHEPLPELHSFIF